MTESVSKTRSTLLEMRKKFNEKFGNGTGFTVFADNVNWNYTATMWFFKSSRSGGSITKDLNNIPQKMKY